MILKLNYILQNSFYNLIRTKGITSTFILSVLISIISFFCFTLFLFFNHIHQQMVLSLENETDLIVLQTNGAPIMAIFFFKVSTFLLFIILVFLSIGYIKKSFKQFLITQKSEFKIMSLLGETSTALQVFYTLQVTIFSLLTISLGAILGNKLFYSSVISTLKIAVGSDNINSFQGSTLLSFFIFLLIVTYIFITTFFISSKKVLSITS